MRPSLLAAGEGAERALTRSGSVAESGGEAPARHRHRLRSDPLRGTRRPLPRFRLLPAAARRRWRRHPRLGQGRPRRRRRRHRRSRQSRCRGKGRDSLRGLMACSQLLTGAAAVSRSSVPLSPFSLILRVPSVIHFWSLCLGRARQLTTSWPHASLAQETEDAERRDFVGAYQQQAAGTYSEAAAAGCSRYPASKWRVKQTAVCLGPGTQQILTHARSHANNKPCQTRVKLPRTLLRRCGECDLRGQLECSPIHCSSAHEDSGCEESFNGCRIA